MDNTTANLDKWREYFRGANADIFNIIENAITVAASDCPSDFKLKRDQIAETLFTCKVTKCSECDETELAVPNTDGRCGIGDEGSKDTKESNGNSSREVVEINVNQVGNCSHGDAEAITVEIEVEYQSKEEILRIKKIIDDTKEESLLFDSLRQLQLMPSSVGILKATDIGKSVNALRKHGSKDVRNLVKTLIGDWKVMVDAWFDAREVTTTDAQESGKQSVVEEVEGLPSVPLNDDDGNAQGGIEFNKNQEHCIKRKTEETDIPQLKFESPSNDPSTPPKDCKAENKRKQESMTLKKQALSSKPNRPALMSESGTKRPDPAVQQKSDKGTTPEKPIPRQQDKLVCDDDTSIRVKLEAAKRKLHERYQETENTKKQRTTKFVELHHLPKQDNQHMRRSNKHWQ